MKTYNLIVHKACPLNCPECRSYLYSEENKIIETEHIKNNSTVNLIGGDPICSEKINTIINDLKSKNCTINIFSSCYYIPEDLRAIKETNIFWITQSFNKKEYNELCGRDFEHVLTNIEKLLKKNIRVIPYICVSKHNIEMLSEINDLLPENAPLWIQILKKYVPDMPLEKNNIENIKYYSKGLKRFNNLVEQKNAGICPFIPAFNSISSKIKLKLINYSYSNYSINRF